MKNVILNRYVPKRKDFVRAKEIPYMTMTLRKANTKGLNLKVSISKIVNSKENSNFFEEAVDKLDIRKCNVISNIIRYPDPV